MSAARTIWTWAGHISSAWGRLKVLGLAFALVAAAGAAALRLLANLGVWDTVLGVITGLAFLIAVLLFVVAIFGPAPTRPSAEAVDRMEEADDEDLLKLAVVAEGMQTWFDEGGIHSGAYHVRLRDVLITNTSRDRVSLMASLHIMVRPGAWGAGGHIPAKAETKPSAGDAGLPPWLPCPIGISSDDSARGYLWFTIGEGDMINVRGDPKEVFLTDRSNRLALRDLVSGQTRYFDVPTLGYLHMDV